jgi:hypothetical protein
MKKEMKSTRRLPIGDKAKRFFYLLDGLAYDINPMAPGAKLDTVLKKSRIRCWRDTGMIFFGKAYYCSSFNKR